MPAAWVVRLPAAIDDDLAAATLLKGITADLLLRDLGRVGPGTRLLVHAAAGGVGLLVCSWARRLGATVIGTVSSEEKARVARDYGCAHPIVTREHRFADAVQTQFGGADVIVDGIGDAARDENFAALARRGHWISLGQASGALQPIATDQLVTEVDHLLAPGGVRLRRDATPASRSAPAGSGPRSATARSRRRRSSAIRSAPPTRRTPGSSRAGRSARWSWSRENRANAHHEEAAMIVGMNHFTAIAEDRQKTLDFYVGLLGLREG